MAEENTKKIEKMDPVVQEGKLFAMVAYLGILCLVPLFFKKDNKFAMFHGKQGLVLFIGESAIWVIGNLFGWLRGLGALIFGVISIIGIIQALMGKYWKLPVGGKLAEKITI
ncbi:MAG: hypothetical protein ABIJ27_02415 [Candidatus Omnitrophota bacterium]